MADDAETRLVVDLTEDGPAAARGPHASGMTPAASDVVVIAEDGAPALPDRAVLQPDGSVILPLLHPVTLRYRNAGSDTVREETLTELRLHRLTGADMRAMSAAKDDGTVTALARSARIHEGKFKPVMDRMDGADVSACFEIIAVFLGTGRRTGR